MRANSIAAEERCVLRLRALSGERRVRAVGGSALGKKIAQALLARADLAVPRSSRDNKGQSYRSAG